MKKFWCCGYLYNFLGLTSKSFPPLNIPEEFSCVYVSSFRNLTYPLENRSSHSQWYSHITLNSTERNSLCIFFHLLPMKTVYIITQSLCMTVYPSGKFWTCCLISVKTKVSTEHPSKPVNWVKGKSGLKIRKFALNNYLFYL